MGDPLRRGCDQSEAIGANMKSTIHRRVSRNKIDGKARLRKRCGADGVQKEHRMKALKVSRVMQAFRAECVRERILRDPKSAPYLQRKHHLLLSKGRSSTARSSVSCPMSVYSMRCAAHRKASAPFSSMCPSTRRPLSVVPCSL